MDEEEKAQIRTKTFEIMDHFLHEIIENITLATPTTTAEHDIAVTSLKIETILAALHYHIGTIIELRNADDAKLSGTIDDGAIEKIYITMGRWHFHAVRNKKIEKEEFEALTEAIDRAIFLGLYTPFLLSGYPVPS